MSAPITRSALREITAMASTGNVNNVVNIVHQLPPTPTSPEEEVIRSRGRRKTTQQACLEQFFDANSPSKTRTRSPRKQVAPTRSSPRTPNKQQISTPLRTSPRTPNKTQPSTPTRTSPRKRLNLGDSATESPSQDPSQVKIIQKAKRPRSEKKKPSNLEASLKALTQSQLVELLKSIIEKHPQIEQDIIEAVPPPDLEPLEKQLKYLQRNINKSFPYVRWGSSRDAFCYRRVCTHLEAFKKACVEQGRHLVDSQQWNAVIDYAVMAWDYVLKMPDWDNPSHNKTKNLCFKGLAAQCMTALKKSKSYFEKADLHEIVERLEELEKDINNTLAPVIDHAKQLQKNK